MKKEKFDIQGMTCSSCQAHVEKAVNKLDGIKKVNVNLLSNNMVVEYDETVLDNAKIIAAVVDAGYGATTENDNVGCSSSCKISEKSEDKKTNIEDKLHQNLKSMKKRLIASFCFLIPLMYVAMHEMLHHMFGLPIPNFIKNLFAGPENALIFAFTQVLLLIPIVILNRNYFVVGFKRLLKRTPNMDSLIALGSTASIVYGIIAIYMIGYGLGHNDLELVSRYSKDIYFESAGTILTLITFGKYLETKSKGKTSSAISKLINLAPKTATVIRNGKEFEIKTEEIILEDIIIVKPGGAIPIDGIVVEGNSSVDQSSITGEPIPVQKEIGDNVVSGTINKNGVLKIKATKVGEDTTLSQIIKLVEEASNSKAPISKIADKVSSIFVPTVILISIITAIVWLLIGQSFEFALTSAIAVLVISCPCALGLATPVAIMVGTGKGAENGILIKDAESLELLHKVDTVVLDKTGTITIGKPKVTDIITSQTLLGNTSALNNARIKIIGNANYNLKVENELLKIAGSLEKNSEHPLADAILEKASENKVELVEVSDFEAVSGRGIKAKIKDKMYYGGNIAFMKENNIDTSLVTEKSEALYREGKTLLYFAKDNELIGVIVVADVIKETSIDAIRFLKNKNLEVVMLTGDNRLAAEAIGKNLNIDKIISEVMPQDKEKEVEKLQKAGKKFAFVGDGINDSPALVRADVGLAIGSGTDIAIEAADIVLMKNDLRDVDTAIELSKATINNVKLSLFWAFIYNIIGIPVASGIFYPIFELKLNPMIGALAMSLSSVCVVTNALRLRRFKNKNLDNVKEKVDSNNENEIIENEMDKTANELKSKIKENKIMKTIKINGMACNHCKMTVEKVLGAIEGVEKVEVILENKEAVVTLNKEVENETFKAVIEEAGFEFVEVI
ncbi:MAG: heavy metal translocating P-type ATPase [Treponema sp.]|nr:heavy metal translocating P-type ATPase [Treponema sp.]